MNYKDLIARLRWPTAPHTFKPRMADAADAIEALVAERDRLKAALDTVPSPPTQDGEGLAALNAERYQWLKAKKIRYNGMAWHWMPSKPLTNPDLDAAIDAAMAQEKEKENRDE